MAVAAFAEHLRVDSGSIVADNNAQPIRRIFYFNFNLFCAGVPKGIYESLATYQIDLIANERTQRARRPFDKHTKVDRPFDGQFLWDRRKSLFQTHKIAIRSAKPANGISPLIDN